MSSDYSLYQLGPYETLWKDDCSVCPAHIEFDVAANCDRQSFVDGRCFRGEFGEQIAYWAYQFQFPPEWSTGTVQYTYSFRYWALGSWEGGDGEDDERGGSEVCAPGHSYSHNIGCIVDMRESRSSKTTCSGWSEWSAPDGSFDPYVQWVASGGDDGNALTACFLDKSYTHSTAESTLTVGFWAWEWVEDTGGISGPRANEAWVVSDFEIEFTPPPFTSLKPDTTKTTAAKTTTTDAPTTTSELPTTAVKSTTTAAVSTDATTTTVSEMTSTNAAKTTTTDAPTTTSEMSTTEVLTTASGKSTAVTTTTEETKDDKGGGGFLTVYVLYGVIGGALFALLCALFCFVSIWNCNRRKNAQPKDEEFPNELQLTAVRSISEEPVEARVAVETRMLPPIPRPLEQVTAHSEDDSSDEECDSELRLEVVGGVGENPEEIVICMDSKPAVYGEDDGTDDDDFGTLEEVLIQLKADARTAEEKAFAEKLDAALCLAPRKLEAEFSMLVQMAVDSQHIGQLLAQKVDIILQAEGRTEAVASAAAELQWEGTTAGRLQTTAGSDRGQRQAADAVTDVQLQDEMMYTSTPKQI